MSRSPAGIEPEQSRHLFLSSLPSRLHIFFPVFATPLVLFLAIWTPPFQSPDEPWHFTRAYLLAHGGVFTARGGNVDDGIARLWDLVSNLPHKPNLRYLPATHLAAAKLQWSGQQVPSVVTNIAMYPPTGYIPQALGIILGQSLGLTVIHTLILSRLLNGFICIGIGTAALRICRGGAVAMFVLLLLPVTLSLLASASQDAMLIACSAFACAVISRQLEAGVPLSIRNALLVTLLFTLVSLGRPPFVVLILVLFAPELPSPSRGLRARIVGGILAVSCLVSTCAWWLYALSTSKGMSKPSAAFGPVDPKLQLVNLLHHLGIVPHLVASAAGDLFYQVISMIGIMGWLDMGMPVAYDLVMLIILAVTLLAELSRERTILWRSRLPLAAAPCIAYVAMYFIQYLIWSPVGSLTVEGPSGRYWIPLCLVAGVGLPCLQKSMKLYERVAALTVAAQIVTLAALPYAIYARYYAP